MKQCLITYIKNHKKSPFTYYSVCYVQFFVHVPWHDEWLRCPYCSAFLSCPICPACPFWKDAESYRGCPVLSGKTQSPTVAVLSVLSRFYSTFLSCLSRYRLRKCFDAFCCNNYLLLASMTLVAKSKFSGAPFKGDFGIEND
jgi:hypothetical protein